MVQEIFSIFRKMRLLPHWTHEPRANATDRLAFNDLFGSIAAFGCGLLRYHSALCGFGLATFQARLGIANSSALHVI
jgi:hypothetical protein